MPPEPGSPLDWLRYARADLALAKIALPEDGLYEQLCFHAQQTVEKCLKAVLIKMGIAFPRTHSIAHLVDLLPTEIPRTADLIDSAQLTGYATVFRYPGDEEPVDKATYDEAVRIAESVLAWAEQRIGS
ncbi:MAG: HEPN domain-containing protein [Bacteroidota bacterium]